MRSARISGTCMPPASGARRTIRGGATAYVLFESAEVSSSAGKSASELPPAGTAAESGQSGTRFQNSNSALLAAGLPVSLPLGLSGLPSSPEPLGPSRSPPPRSS